jgi:L-iditol 2-dehydrogenase
MMDHPFFGQPPYGSLIPGHEYAAWCRLGARDVDELKVGDRIAVEAHLGCLRCRNCRNGNYTACLKLWHAQASGQRYASNGGFAQYVVKQHQYSA